MTLWDVTIVRMNGAEWSVPVEAANREHARDEGAAAFVRYFGEQPRSVKAREIGGE